MRPDVSAGGGRGVILGDRRGIGTSELRRGEGARDGCAKGGNAGAARHARVSIGTASWHAPVPRLPSSTAVRHPAAVGILVGGRECRARGDEADD